MAELVNVIAHNTLAKAADFNAVQDGVRTAWVPCDTWVYVSATSFKIVGVDQTDFYNSGMRLRWKQGASYLYSTVDSSAYTTDTTITTTGGDAVTNATITDNYRSYVTAPEGYSYTAASVADLQVPQYLTLATTATLTNERVFTPGDGLDAVDGGAGGLYTLNLDVTDIIGVGLDEDGSNNLVIGTPTTLAVATTNSVSGTTHSHAITSSANPGAAAAILASSAAGALTLVTLNATTVAGTTVTGANVTSGVDPGHTHTGIGTHAILSATHTDTTAAAVVRGDIIIGSGATPKWTRYALSVPAGAALLNVLGVINGETESTWKALFDATAPTTLAVATAAAAGTATVASHRDHAHAITSSANPGAAAAILASTAAGGLTLEAFACNGGIIVNEAGADSDTRFESDGNANMLLVDAGNDTVWVGTAAEPTELIFAGPIDQVLRAHGAYDDALDHFVLSGTAQKDGNDVSGIALGVYGCGMVGATGGAGGAVMGGNFVAHVHVFSQGHASACGVEIDTNNNKADTTGRGDENDVVGMQIFNGGTYTSKTALLIANFGGANKGFLDGIRFYNDCIRGGTVIDINQCSSAGVGISLPNNVPIQYLNSAGGGVPILSVDTSNWTVLRSGGAGFVFPDTAGSANLLTIANAGAATFAAGLVVNESGADSDTRFEGDTATNLLVVDAGLDAVQIGTTVAGAIADFRAATIVFNEASADLDFRVETNAEANALFVDGGANRVSIGATTLFAQGGTAFPASPTTNDLYFRTDLGWWCYFDGTRWLTAHEFAVALPYIYSTSSTSNAARLRTDFAPYFTRVAVSSQVDTTNEETKYWTVIFYGMSAAMGGWTSIYTYNTKTDGVGAYVSHEAAPTTAIPANNTFVRMHADLTSTAGPITLHAQLFYRLIVT